MNLDKNIKENKKCSTCHRNFETIEQLEKHKEYVKDLTDSWGLRDKI